MTGYLDLLATELARALPGGPRLGVVPAGRRRPVHRVAAAARRRDRPGGARRRARRNATGRSTAERSPPRSSSPTTCCPGSPPNARSSKRSTWPPWTSTREPSNSPATTRPTSATWRSTSSRCSVSKRRSAVANSAVSRSTTSAACWPRPPARPRVRWRRRSRRATATRRRSTPQTHSVTLPAAFKESVLTWQRGRVDAHRPGRGHRRPARTRDGPLGDQRVPGRRPARGVLLPRRPADDGRPVQRRQRAAEALGRIGRRAQLGCHDGAHRARRGLRRRRRAHQGRRTARRHLAPRRREALHHQRRLRRPVREHRPPGAGAAGRRGAGHQGTQPVPGARSSCPTPRRRHPASATASTSPDSSTRWG